MRNIIVNTVLFVMSGALSSSVAARVKQAGPMPDFTLSGKPGDYHDYALGATGARGWIYGIGNTDKARQILITNVETNSPADGKLAKGDVILGLAGRAFTSDARIAIAKAITQAESPAGGGSLSLIRWRNGKRSNVNLSLNVLGSYSDTSVLSPKTLKIIEAAADHLAKKGLKKGIPGHINALGLLATGDSKYLPLVKKHADAIDGPVSSGSLLSWSNAYRNLFLTEYYLATGDRSALPKIKAISRSLIDGQNVLGLWGHGYKADDGSCSGYGALNQVGLVCALSLALAQKCNVEIEGLNRAVKRSVKCFEWYVDKGGIPYGYHKPWGGHTTNGKNAIAAVFMDVAGNKKAAGYFSRLSATATASERESGHTGHYFNMLWGPLGAARAGDEAAAAHLKELRWMFDLQRLHSGGAVYQGNPGSVKLKYKNWDCTGAMLLAYTTPRRKLYITGRNGGMAEQLKGATLRSVIEAGKINYDTLSASELEQLLGNWSPVVRTEAAKTLAQKGADTNKILTLLRSPDRYTRYGACRVLEAMGAGASGAVDDLIGLLKDKDVWLRCRVIRALGAIADARAIDPLLKIANRGDAEHDPLERVQHYLGLTLFYTGRAMKIKTFVVSNEKRLLSADRKLLIPAIKRLLLNANGQSRSAVAKFCEKLPWEDVEKILPELMYAARFMPPGCKMFSWDARLSPYNVLCKYGVKQVVDVGVTEWMLLTNGGGQHKWQQPGLKGLKLFGSDAREYLPLLEKLEKHIANQKKRNQQKWSVHKVIPPMIPKVRQALSGSKGHPQLRRQKVKLLDYSAVKGLDLIE